MWHLTFTALITSAVLTIPLSLAAPPPAAASSCPTGFSLVAGTTNVCERRFTSTGTTTWNVPSGMSIDVMVVGGGGGGGGGGTSASGGGGGGGGGIVATSGLAVTSSTTFTVTVGTGGTYGSSGDDGQAGGSSSFTSSSPSITITASGGSGGTKGSGSNGPGGAAGTGSCSGCATSISPGGGGGGTGADGVGVNGSNGVTLSGSSSSSYGLLRQGSSSIAVAGGGGGGGGSTSSTGGTGGGGNGGGLSNSVPGTANTGGGGGGGGSKLSTRSKSGANGGSGVVIIRTLASDPPAPTPTFDTPVRTAGGFTVNVTNHDAAYTWTPSVSTGSVTAGTPSGSTLPLTVTGLSAGASSTVTVTTSRTGYSNGSASVSGQAKSTQTVTWAPTTAVTTVQSPLTPSASATALGGAPITYSEVSNTTTSCSVDATTGQLTYTGTGNCVVRATAAATSAYLEGTTVVTFEVSKATQTVSWSPTTAVTTVQSPLTPSASASALGGAPITYSTVSNTTTSCSVDATTGQLTYTGTGNCVVRATAATTDDYNSGFAQVTFTVSKATPTLSWSPTTAFTVPAASTTFAAATTNSDGALSYSLTSNTAGCTLVGRTLSFTQEGDCEVTASVTATDTYDATTSVKTFAISKAAQTVTWAPSSTLTLASSSATLATASTSGDGAVTYSVTTQGGTGCAFTDNTQPVLTYATAGSCSVTATAASTTGYAQGTQSVTIAITLATPTMSWAPTTALTMPAATITPSVLATSTGDGVITYAVTSDSGTNCTVDTNTGALTYTATGSCQVTATSAATSRYTSASTPVTFTVSLAPQTITATATSTSLQPGGTTTLSTTGSSGSGAITWTLTSGASACSLTGTTVRALAAGTCVLTASIAADATYASASNALTITVTTPGGGGGGGSGGGSGDSGTGGSGNASGNGTSATSGSGGSSSIGAGNNQSTDGVQVPGATSDTRGRELPPPPENVKVRPVREGVRSSVIIKQPAQAAGAQALATVVVVRDAKGTVVSRVNVALRTGQGEVEVTVPYVAEGYSVNVYNVNEVGVSTGALTSSPLVRATTITTSTTSGRPSLFGVMLGKPILFSGGSASLDATDKQQLRGIAHQAKASNEQLFVTGFARKGGGSTSELAPLSTERARAAATYLSKQGVRVWIRYWGAGSLNGTGALTDRRVEVRTSASPIPRTLVQ